MPGVGLTKPREFADAEKQAMTEGAAELGLELEDVLSIWGSSAVEVYLNGESFWDAVPAAVWEYTIGGYLMLKKWLSYRDLSILGRGLTKDEAREFTQMVRRIAALLLLDPTLDANYLAVKSDLYAWPREVDEGAHGLGIANDPELDLSKTPTEPEALLRELKDNLPENC